MLVVRESETQIEKYGKCGKARVGGLCCRAGQGRAGQGRAGSYLEYASSKRPSTGIPSTSPPFMLSTTTTALPLSFAAGSTSVSKMLRGLFSPTLTKHARQLGLLGWFLASSTIPTHNASFPALAPGSFSAAGSFAAPPCPTAAFLFCFSFLLLAFPLSPLCCWVLPFSVFCVDEEDEDEEDEEEEEEEDEGATICKEKIRDGAKRPLSGV